MKSKPFPMTAVILAGGKSSRLGREKALFPLNGKTLLEQVIKNLKPCFSEAIISISATSNIRGGYSGCRIIVDEMAGCGPLMGILSGLRISASPINFVCACDIPEIHREFIERMINFTGEYEAVIPLTGPGLLEPLFGFYHRDLIPGIELFLESGHRKVNRFLAKCRTKFVHMEPNHWYRNLNTLQDYRDYLKPNHRQDLMAP